MKRIMILGAGLYQVPLIETAKRMGLETIVVSVPGPYRGFEIADRCYAIDTRDREKILQAAKEEEIGGICTTGTDVAVSSIGYVCEKLGLKGISPKAAETLCDKALMKEAFLRGGVSCARGERAYSKEQAEEIAGRLGYPVVVKRVDSSGSRGITVVSDRDGINGAYLHAREKTLHDYVVVEKLLKGREIGVDGFIRGGRVIFCAPHDKFLYHGKNTTVPMGHAFPLSCGAALREEIRRQMQLAADAVGADNCCFNADVFVDGDKAWIIEMGGRCGATCIPELIRAHWDFDFYEAMITEAMGGQASFPEGEGSVPCMAKLLCSPVSGTLTAVDAAALEAVRNSGAEVAVDPEIGGHVYAMSDGTDRIGSVLMKTAEEKELDGAMACLSAGIFINGRRLSDLWND